MIRNVATNETVPISSSKDPSRSSMLVSANKDSSLNNAFRDFKKSQEQSQEKIKQPNSVDEFGDKFVRIVSKIVKRGKKQKEKTEHVKEEKRKSVGPASDTKTQKKEKDDRNIVQEIVKDFSQEGDRKILRAIGRTAAVNAAVLATTFTGGAAGAGAAGLLTGGAFAAKRLGDGVQQEDEAEVAKSLATFGSATTASIVGQVATSVAFGVGCASGITAGALSEWGVDRALGEEQGDRDIEDEEGKDETVDDVEKFTLIASSGSSTSNADNAESTMD